MASLDQNKNGKVSPQELKQAVREVLKESQEEAQGQNRGKKMAKAITNLVFMKAKMPDHLKMVYTGKGSAIETMHTGNSKCNINNCHTSGLQKLRQPVNVKIQPNTLGNAKKGPVLDPNFHKERLDKLKGRGLL